jgi:two-component system LytT family response regulator
MVKLSTVFLARSAYFVFYLNKMNNNPGFILIGNNQSRFFLPTEDILYVQAVRVYSIIYLRGSKKQYIIARNIGNVYNDLDVNKFLRVHKSYIINMHEIKCCELSRKGKVILSDDTEIHVAQRRKYALIHHLGQMGTKQI